MRNSEALENMIAAEQAKLDKLEEKQEDLSRKIKTCKANIEKYKLMKNNLQFNALSNALDEKGIRRYMSKCAVAKSIPGRYYKHNNNI